jgi:hypothetical protein
MTSRSSSTAADGFGQQQGLRQRLSDMWHDVILGERHVLRMYNDLGVIGQVGCCSVSGCSCAKRV